MKKNSKQTKKITVVKGAFGYAPGKNLVGVVEKLLTPPEGGIFTKYLGCNYWFKGYPDEEILDYIYPSKRIVNGVLLLLRNKPLRFLAGISGFVFLLFPRPLKKAVVIALLDFVIGITHCVEYKHPFELPTKRYCQSVREIFRVSEKFLADIKDRNLGVRYAKIRDIFLMILEMDAAYRFRFQDIIPEFNKDNLKIDPIGEFRRVFRIFINREGVDGDNGMLPKWQSLERIIILTLHIPKFRKLIVGIILEMDLTKIQRDEADWYFSLDRSDYNYGGMSHSSRLEIMSKLDKKMGNKRYQVFLPNGKNIQNNI